MALKIEANDLISDAADKAAEALNLTDFYAVHIMNYCKGYFETECDRK